MQPTTSNSWSWGEVSEDTKTSVIIDAGLNTGDSLRSQIIELADKRVTAGQQGHLIRGNKRYMKIGARRLSQCTMYFGKAPAPASFDTAVSHLQKPTELRHLSDIFQLASMRFHCYPLKL